MSKTKLTPSVAGKTLLLINTGDLKKRFILQRLKKLEVNIIAVNQEVNWAKDYVSDWIITDTNKHDETIRKVADYLKNHKIDGIFTFWEDDVILTSKLNEKFNLVGIPVKSAETARNKFKFRQFCRDHNLPAPKFLKVNGHLDLKKVEKELSFPVVVKPIYGSSSAFVIKAEDSQDLVEVYEFLQKNISSKVESALEAGLSLMIEEYIDGDEVDIDLILQNGKIKFWSIADNLPTKEPFFLESGYQSPSMLHEQDQKELLNMAELVLEKLGVMNGIIHFEAKISETGPVPIEVNLRMGGDEIYPSVKEIWRIDLIEQAVNVASNTYIPKTEKPIEPYSYIAAQSLIAEKSGVISKLRIPKKFDKNLKVEEFHFHKEVGDTVFAPPDDYEFLGWLSVSGDNPNDADENLESVLKQIEYEIVPFSSISAMGKLGSFSKSKAKIAKLKYIDKQNQRKLHIGIACNGLESSSSELEKELNSVGKTIEKTLQDRDYQTTFIDFNNLSESIEILKSGQIDLVFNVAERLNNSSLLEPHIASLFDAFQIPYTGSNPFTLGLCIDKIRVKKLLSYHNIPTAKWDYAYSLKDEIRSDLHFPLIVKPANTDNSIGINNNSVVTNKLELKAQLEYVLEKLKRPALVEEYLSGDEYDVSITGSEEDDLQVLPLSRTIFDKLPEGYWHICPFDFKFREAEIYKNKLEIQRPAKNVSKKLTSLISEIALDTYNILDCHDYGRVEIKLDQEGNPYVLELNPNPSINIGNCVPAVAQLMGLSYADFIEKIIALAIRRYQNKDPFYHLQTNLL